MSRKEPTPIPPGSTKPEPPPAPPAMTGAARGWTEASGKAWVLIRDAMVRAARAEREETTTERFNAILDAVAAQCERNVAAILTATPRVPNGHEGNAKALVEHVVQRVHGDGRMLAANPMEWYEAVIEATLALAGPATDPVAWLERTKADRFPLHVHLNGYEPDAIDLDDRAELVPLIVGGRT